MTPGRSVVTASFYGRLTFAQFGLPTSVAEGDPIAVTVAGWSLSTMTKTAACSV